jgi:hypothetical protein
MTSDPKSFTFTPAVDAFEEIELREPIDLDAVSRLIGATKDFVAGARSYLDALEGSAIFSLALSELSKGDREALELSSEVIRPLFNELADTFVESYRETQPALAEQGYKLLWAALRAAATIGKHSAVTEDTSEIGADVVKEKRAGRARNGKPRHQEEFVMALKAEADALGEAPVKSIGFVQKIAPGLQTRIGSKKRPGKDRIYTAVDLIRAWEGGS